MDDIRYDNELNDTTDAHVPASEVAGAHESDGTLGRVAGTGSGAIAGGIIGAVAGPLGAVIGAVAGGALGAAAGDAAHHMGDDHDDVNIDTGSDGELGRYSGTGAGGISGAVVGGVAAGPLGALTGAVAGGVLGAEAGDGAKDMGDKSDDTLAYDVAPIAFAGPLGTPGAVPVVPTIPPENHDLSDLGVEHPSDNPDYNPRLAPEPADEDTRGVMERISDAATGDKVDDNTGRPVIPPPYV